MGNNACCNDERVIRTGVGLGQGSWKIALDRRGQDMMSTSLGNEYCINRLVGGFESQALVAEAVAGNDWDGRGVSDCTYGSVLWGVWWEWTIETTRVLGFDDNPLLSATTVTLDTPYHRSSRLAGLVHSH